MLLSLFLAAFGFAQQEWFVFEPPSKSFRVELPSKPNSNSSRTLTISSKRYQVASTQLRAPEATYSVQVIENRDNVDPDTLDDGIREFAAARQGALGPITPISVDGRPGREFEMTEQSVRGPQRSKQRWVTAGPSLFRLSVVANPGDNVPAATGRFLGSLQIRSVTPTAAAPVEPRAASSGKDAAQRAGITRKSAGPSVTISDMPRDAKAYPDEKLEDLGRSFVAANRDGFRDVGPEGSVLAGVRVTYIERFGGPKVGSAQPIYRSGTDHYLGQVHGEVVGPAFTFVAKPGYAVGGLVAHTGLTVDGFRMVFMKVDGDHLDPDDQYNSPWIGDVKGGSPGEVNTKGGLIVGLQGRAGKEVFALGLTELK